MLQIFFRIRYMAVLAVLAGLLGALLLFIVGGYHTLEAYPHFLGFTEMKGQLNK